MATEFFVPILGVAADILQIFSFSKTHFASPASPSAVVMIQTGFQDHCNTTVEAINPLYEAVCFPIDQYLHATGTGELVQVEIFNEIFDSVGRSKGEWTFSPGQTLTQAIDTGGQDATYIKLMGALSQGGVCIAWVSVTYPNGNQHAFVGDWWKYCNVTELYGGTQVPEWYYGNVEAGQVSPNDPAPWYPLCGWIEAGGNCGHKISAMMANVVSLQNTDDQNYHALCDPNNLWWSNSLDFNWANSNSSDGIGRRSRRKNGSCRKERNSQTYTSLIRSDIWSHNATELCTSSNSRGPDFISVSESMHCDMDARTLTPLCTNDIDGAEDSECFSLEEETNVGKRWSRKRSVSKQYSRVVDWKHEELHERAMTRRDGPPPVVRDDHDGNSKVFTMLRRIVSLLKRT